MEFALYLQLVLMYKILEICPKVKKYKEKASTLLKVDAKHLDNIIF